MSKFMLAVSRFIRDEEGATAIEYGLIAALISVVMIVSLGGVGEGVQESFEAVCTALDTALPVTLACGA